MNVKTIVAAHLLTFKPTGGMGVRRKGVKSSTVLVQLLARCIAAGLMRKKVVSVASRWNAEAEEECSC